MQDRTSQLTFWVVGLHRQDRRSQVSRERCQPAKMNPTHPIKSSLRQISRENDTNLCILAPTSAGS